MQTMTPPPSTPPPFPPTIPLHLPRHRYTAGLFWLDLAAAVPWDLVLRVPLVDFMGLSPVQASILGLTRMLRTYRL